MTGQAPRSSLFRSSEGDTRLFLLTLAASILCHLGLVVALIFASEHTPQPAFSHSVIDVTMVTAPAEGPPGAAPEPAEPPPPKPLTPAEREALLMDQAPPAPEPEPPQPKPEPDVAPAPEPPPETPAPEPRAEPPSDSEKVVIDPVEPEEPPPPKPEPRPEKRPTPKPAPEKPAPKPAARPESGEAPPIKKPAYRKPDKPAPAVEAPASSRSPVEEAIRRIERSVAMRNRQAPAGGGGAAGGAAGESGGGAAMGIQARAAITSYAGSVLPDRINRNWAFSEHLASRRFNLEAVLVIKIRADGEIVDIFFERKSGDAYFDDSAYKAVVKSNPLPPLPGVYAAYRDTYTVGLRFTPSGLN